MIVVLLFATMPPQSPMPPQTPTMCHTKEVYMNRPPMPQGEGWQWDERGWWYRVVSTTQNVGVPVATPVQTIQPTNRGIMNRTFRRVSQPITTFSQGNCSGGR